MREAPPKPMLSASMPFFRKIPVSMPISTGANSKGLACGLPMRSLSAEKAGPAPASASAAPRQRTRQALARRRCIGKTSLGSRSACGPYGPPAFRLSRAPRESHGRKPSSSPLNPSAQAAADEHRMRLEEAAQRQRQDRDRADVAFERRAQQRAVAQLRHAGVVALRFIREIDREAARLGDAPQIGMGCEMIALVPRDRHVMAERQGFLQSRQRPVIMPVLEIEREETVGPADQQQPARAQQCELRGDENLAKALIVRHEVGIAVARADMLDDAVRHGEIEFLHLGIKPRHVLAEAGMDEAAHLGKRIVEPTARLESPGIVAELAQGRDRMAHAAADIEHPDRGRLAPRKVAAQQWRNEAARKTLAAESLLNA